MGAALLAAGGAIVIRKGTRCAAIFLGATMLGWFLFLHLPRIVATPRNPGPWTSGFEILGMCGAALVLASDGSGSRFLAALGMTGGVMLWAKEGRGKPRPYLGGTTQGKKRAPRESWTASN